MVIPGGWMSSGAVKRAIRSQIQEGLDMQSQDYKKGTNHQYEQGSEKSLCEKKNLLSDILVCFHSMQRKFALPE